MPSSLSSRLRAPLVQRPSRAPALSLSVVPVIALPARFALDPDVSPNEKAALLVVAAYANLAGEARLQYGVFVEHLRFSPRFIRKLLVGLRSKGYLRWQRRYRHNLYRLCL